MPYDIPVGCASVYHPVVLHVASGHDLHLAFTPGLSVKQQPPQHLFAHSSIIMLHVGTFCD